MLQRAWVAFTVLFYPLAAATLPVAIVLLGPSFRLDRFSALISGFIVFLVLWLAALPRDLSWGNALDNRWALPVTGYLCGLLVAAVLMALTRKH